VFRDVLRAFGAPVRFLVVTHHEGVDLLAEWVRDLGMVDRTRVVSVPDQTKFSVWAQDSFIVCSDSQGGRLILQPLNHEHPGETVIARTVAEFLGWDYRQVPGRLQSGNVLVGDDFWLMGADSAEKPSGELPRPDQEPGATTTEEETEFVLDATRTMHLVSSDRPVPGFEEELLLRDAGELGSGWQEAVYRGNRVGTTQPIFHVDSFISLAGREPDGRYRILVGDPALAARTIGTDLPEHALQDVFDRVAFLFERAGLVVSRVPLPLVYHDNKLTRVRHWYFASYNNAIVEIVGDSKRVWLPTYGHGKWKVLVSTDEMVRDVWRGLGFETRTLTDFHPFASNLGSLRCMAKCLERSDEFDAGRVES